MSDVEQTPDTKSSVPDRIAKFRAERRALQGRMVSDEAATRSVLGHQWQSIEDDINQMKRMLQDGDPLLEPNADDFV